MSTHKHVYLVFALHQLPPLWQPSSINQSTATNEVLHGWYQIRGDDDLIEDSGIANNVIGKYVAILIIFHTEHNITGTNLIIS